VGTRLIPFYAMGTGINPKTELKCCTPSYPRGTNIQAPPFREAYIIYSSGPLDTEPGGHTMHFPVNTINGWMVYAATNGTKSSGGIITTGGATLELPSLANLRATHF